MKNIYSFFLFLSMGVLVWTVGVSAPAMAQGANTDNLIYEEPTMKNLSRLYWALSRLDTEDMLAVDNYVMINECDIYKDYSNHEFEWKKVRESAKEFIDQNKRSFPLRFQFTQPLRLGEYDVQSQKFEILNEYTIPGTRRFEVRASDASHGTCGVVRGITGYPRGLMLELSRPFRLTELELPPDVASAYISQKLENFRNLKSNYQTQRNVYEMRDAYLVMKVRMFASEADVRAENAEVLAHVYAALEAVEIYADPEKQNLLYSSNYRQRRERSKMDDKLREEYQAERRAQQIKEREEAAERAMGLSPAPAPAKQTDKTE